MTSIRPGIIRKVAIPQPTTDPVSLKGSVDALKEAIEIGSGQRGNPMDRFVTVGELKDAGATVNGRGGISALGGGSGGNTDTGTPVFNPWPPDDGSTDFTPPPAPTGVAAHAVSQEVIAVTWDVPEYTHHKYAEVFFLTDDGDFNHVIAPPAFDVTKPVSASNPEDHYAGVSYGTIYMHVGLAAPQGETLDELLNPTPRYYWVRFVSTAGVPGPFNTTGTGVKGVPFVDPGRIIDAMTASVSSSEIYGNLRALIGSDPAAVAANGGISGISATIGDWTLAGQTLSEVVENADGTLSSIWSVRMQQTNGGLNYAAGFGLGMTVDAATGESQSSFIVNSDQFAIMAPTSPTVALTSFARKAGDNTRAIVTWTKPTIGTTNMVAGSTMRLVCDGDRSWPPSVLASLSPVVETIDETLATATLLLAAGWPDVTADAAGCAQHGLALIADVSMPFVVDSLRSVVGVNGKMIVNGLLAATAGQFDDLTATTAFVQKLTASIVNANVIVGQRIVAGVAGAGQAQDTDIDGYASNYIVELNNPITGRSPLRYYIPKGSDGLPHTAFELTKEGGLNMAGDLSVGGNGVIRTTGNYLTAMGGTNASGQKFALWVGSQADYEGGHPTAPDGFNETNGLLWVRGDSKRGGFNADMFLGGDPFTIPSGNGDINVVPTRSGQNGLVFVSMMAGLAPDGNGSRDGCTWHVGLFLVPQSYVGPGARVSALRTALQTQALPRQAYLDSHIGITLTPSGSPPYIPGGLFICDTIYEWWKDADMKTVNMQGVITCPPGAWKAFMTLYPNPNNQGPAHACWSASAVAMQVQR